MVHPPGAKNKKGGNRELRYLKEGAAIEKVSQYRNRAESSWCDSKEVKGSGDL